MSPFCAEIEQALGRVVREAVQAAANVLEEVVSPRWTLKRLAVWVDQHFSRVCGRETLRRALKRLGLSWKKAKKLLAKADSAVRAAFGERIQELRIGATRQDHLRVYLDEAHIHQDADLGYGWSVRGARFWVGSSSPGLSAKVSFYGLYLYNEGQVESWPDPKANRDFSIEALERLREQCPTEAIKLLWDGASYHRSLKVRQRAAELDIELIRLPAYSPDFMPVEALWRWLREDVTYQHCHSSAEALIDTVEQFRQRINTKPNEIADRLWVKDQLNSDEEKLRISK